MKNQSIIDRLLAAHVIKISCNNKKNCSCRGELSKKIDKDLPSETFLLKIHLSIIGFLGKTISLKRSDIEESDTDSVIIRIKHDQRGPGIMKLELAA